MSGDDGPNEAPDLAAPSVDPPEEPDTADAALFGTPELVGHFDAEVVPGASGLASSIRHPGLLYLLDDRAGTGEVHVLGPDGRMRGAIPVAGLDARDTESLALGPCPGGGTCLHVADSGDNLENREDITIHRLPEPEDADGPWAAADADVAVLRYPDGPRDAEALLVDDDGTLYLITKPPPDPGGQGPTEVYRAPFGDGTLERVGELELPMPERPLQSRFTGRVVTGAGRDQAGRVLLRTYDSVLLAEPPSSTASLDGLPSWPLTEVPGPPLLQPEAIAWATDRCGYHTASERSGDLWFVPCAEAWTAP